MRSSEWLNGIVLTALLVALYMNWSWPWGLLFIYWAVPSYFSGEAFLVGPVLRKDSPIQFWVVVTLWLLLGVMMVLVDAAPYVIKDIYAFMWRLH